MARTATRTNSFGLTGRELEVLRLFVAGYTCKRVVGELGIALSTVRKHREHIMTKMDVCEKASMVRKAMLAGFDKDAVPVEPSAPMNVTLRTN